MQLYQEQIFSLIVNEYEISQFTESWGYPLCHGFHYTLGIQPE